MEQPERKERPERSEKQIKRREKQTRADRIRPDGTMMPGTPKGSGLYDQNFSVRLGVEHLDILDRIGKGKPRGEVVRDMITVMGKKMAEAGKI